MDMGFQRQQAQVALERNDNNPDLAAEWLMASADASAAAGNDSKAEALPSL